MQATILVVDDTSEQYLGLERKSCGTITECWRRSNGEAGAQDRPGEIRPPDLILLDVIDAGDERPRSVPGASRPKAATRKIPVIFVTRHESGSEDESQRFFCPGGRSTTSPKPVSPPIVNGPA